MVTRGLSPRQPIVGLALGSGSARGWAHFGVLHAMRELGMSPDIICGTSIGSLVGAAYAAGEMDRFEQWVLSLGMRKVFGFMDFNLGGGMIKGDKIIDFLREHFVQESMEELGAPFGCVATDLHSGAEVWLRKGSLADAVRASIALPGLFKPVVHEGRMLVDGGLVNPVPVSLARAMGADIVIAVDLNADIMRRHMRPLETTSSVRVSTRHVDLAKLDPEMAVQAGLEQGPEEAARRGWRARFRRTTTTTTTTTTVPTAAAGSGLSSGVADSMRVPSLANVVLASVNIMQMRITRSRMAGDPPELLIAPRLAQIGLMDFHRAREAIDEGYAAARAALPELRHWGLNIEGS